METSALFRRDNMARAAVHIHSPCRSAAIFVHLVTYIDRTQPFAVCIRCGSLLWGCYQIQEEPDLADL